jgi:hypothetical protein
MWTGCWVTQAGHIITHEQIARGYGDENAIGSQLSEFIFYCGPSGDRVRVPRATDREIHRRDRILKRVAVLMNPLQRALDPTKVTIACIVEYAQANEIGSRRYPVVVGAGTIGTDDASNM